MADKSLSELNNTTSSNDKDLYLVSQKNTSGKYESKKIDWSNIKNNIKTFLQGFFVRTDNTNQEINGTKTFKGKFVYSGMEEANTNANRTIWFSDNSTQGKPVYDNDFKYNPVTNILDVKKLNTGVSLVASPSDTAIGHEVVDAAWVRKVIQVDDSTVTTQYVSSSGNDANDGKSVATAKRTIMSAMNTLNKYRLASAQVVYIKLLFDGIYDLNNSGIPICHPDAINQHFMYIGSSSSITTKKGKDGKDKLYIPTRLTNTYNIQPYTHYSMLGSNVDNLYIEKLHISGYSNKNITSGILHVMNQPYGTLIFNNVEIGKGFTGLFNGTWSNRRIDLQNYCAFSNIQFNSSTESCYVVSKNPYNISNFDINTATGVKIVFKDISSCNYDIVLNTTPSPTVGRAWVFDIVLDNVTCKLSNSKGFKRYQENGSEYHFRIYLLNGTKIGNVLPNVVENDYNHIYTEAPSWYDPEWDKD